MGTEATAAKTEQNPDCSDRWGCNAPKTEKPYFEAIRENVFA
jgi:hypothetical protein